MDDPSDLPEQRFAGKSGKYIYTVGDKNKDYEIPTFGVLFQPLYMFLDTEDKPLTKGHYGYDSNTAKFVKHLDDLEAAFEAGRQ